MSRYISENDRRLVAERANHCCEYCLMHSNDSFFSFQIDHIISIKHGGKNELVNFAYCCLFCNKYKGSDVGSIIWPEEVLVRLFHPRKDVWLEHFELDGPEIKAKSAVGRATVNLLLFNTPERLMERAELIELRRYPVIVN